MIYLYGNYVNEKIFSGSDSDQLPHFLNVSVCLGLN